jgi:Siphovirus Gp157
MATDLTASLAAHEYLRSWLRLEFPDIEDEALRDTVEGISDLPQVVAAVVRSHLDDLALASALQSRLANMQERLTRIEGRAEKKRALVASVMGRADLRKLTEPDFTVSLRPTPQPLLVTAESDIPATYWKPQPPKLDRNALISTLKAGERIPGASLGNGGVTIAVRTR